MKRQKCLRPCLIALLFALDITFAASQSVSLLTSGPMLGYVEHREALIWLEVSRDVTDIEIRYKPVASEEYQYTRYAGTLGRRYNPVKIALEELNMDTEYEYDIWLNGHKTDTSYTFRTKELWEWRTDAPDFSFLFGSCFYVNDSLYDRPGRPYGTDPSIFEYMADIPTDFMIWGGDNLYLREADYSSPSGIRYRYSYHFSLPQLKRLRATRANYAIWDDHDYGPNNSNAAFELKDVALQVFSDYWGNKSFGEPDNPGAYTKFQWSDAEFFLLDNRYYRDDNAVMDSVGGQPNPAKRHLGREQMNWLKNSLASSVSLFKIIVVGGQVLNPLNQHESFRRYTREYQELMNFIQESRINGVLFLTGDRHFTELQRWKPDKGYPLYDLTCSPVTSGYYDISKSTEWVNPGRVEGSLYMKHNFARISVTGPRNERRLLIEILDHRGNKVWEYAIHQKEIRFE